MRILLSAYACEPGRGSEPGNGWNWSLALARLGHEVWTLTRPAGRPAIDRQDVPRNLHVIYVEAPRRAEPFLKGQAGVYVRYLLWQRAAYRVACTLEAAHDFDVVHHVTWGSLKGGSKLWRLDKPFVLGPVSGGQTAPHAFGAYLDGGRRQEVLRTALTHRALPYAPGLSRMLRHTSLLLAANQETLTLAQRMGAQRGRLFLDTGLPAHFYPKTERPPRAAGPLRVLWVGRLYPIKGLRLALEALGQVRVPFCFTILGGGPLADRVPEWLRAYGLEDSTSYRGHVPWARVLQAYRTHDVFLFTSLRDSFGSQLLEAMASGLPVVTLDHHGASDFVPEEGGIKVPVTTPEETTRHLSRAIEALEADPARRRRVAAAGIAFAQTQEWSRRASRVSALYQTLR